MINLNLSKEAKYLVLVCLSGAIIILLCGIFSDLYLGDETFHYRLATYIYKANFQRPLYDPLALTNPSGKCYYYDPMGWHFFLALFWKLFFGVSKASAQVFQVIWYMLLVLSTYLLGTEIRDKKTGLFSALIVATMPMAVALSIILHTDIAVAALCTISLFFLIKKRLLAAALIIALATYTKRNSYMLLPGFLILTLYPFFDARSFKDFLKILTRWFIFFLIPFLIAITPAITYRYSVFGLRSFISGNIREPVETSELKPIELNLHYVNITMYHIINNISLDSARYFSAVVPLINIQTQYHLPQSLAAKPGQQTHFTLTIPVASAPIGEYLNKVHTEKTESKKTGEFLYEYKGDSVPFYDESNILINPFAFLKYFGLAIAFAVFLYMIRLKFAKKDIFLWFLIANYLPLFFYVFKGSFNIRYFSPIIGYIAVMAGMGIASSKAKCLKYLIIFLCIVQFFSVAIYTRMNRIIPPGLKQVYSYIAANTPKEARVLCTKNALALHADRNSIWLGTNSLKEINFLFWQASKAQMVEIFDKYDINYILVEKDKIYDDSESKHTGGYPKSFVDKIRALDIFTIVLENQSAALWKIKR